MSSPPTVEASREDAAPDAAARRDTLTMRVVVLFSVVSGFAMAAKINFAPVLILPFLVLPGIRHRLLYVGGTLASFVFFTLPILAEYPRMASWFTVLTVSSGVHGQGGDTFIDPQSFVANLATILRVESVFSWVLAAAIALLAVGVLDATDLAVAGGRGRHPGGHRRGDAGPEADRDHPDRRGVLGGAGPAGRDP